MITFGFSPKESALGRGEGAEGKRSLKRRKGFAKLYEAPKMNFTTKANFSSNRNGTGILAFFVPKWLLKYLVFINSVWRNHGMVFQNAEFKGQC